MVQIIGTNPANRAEQRVLESLKEQLPQNWVVVPNVAWCQHTKSYAGGPTWISDGEADFVIFAPGYGYLIMEVKGSKFVRVNNNGQWQRSSNGNSWVDIEGQNPMQQATSNMYQIRDKIEKKFGSRVRGLRYSSLVVYPSGEVRPGSFPMYDKSVIVDKSKMHRLKASILGALEARGTSTNDRNLDYDLSAEIARFLTNCNSLVEPSSIEGNIADDGKAIEELTSQQFTALNVIFKNPLVAITGPAGSGKTILAIWRLLSLVNEGKNAIYLCYNKSLAEYLRLRHPELNDNIQSVDSFFTRITRSSSFTQEGDKKKYFEESLPGKVSDMAMDYPEYSKYDSIIVDEGQDFGFPRMVAINDMKKRDGDLLYFSDESQNLYGGEVLKEVGAEILCMLIHNCRNTRKINEVGNHIAEKRIAPMPGLPLGESHIVESFTDEASMAKEAWRIVSKWAAEGETVAILSPYKLENSCMNKQLSGYNKTITTELSDWVGTNGVLFSTIKSFKGIEADVVIIVDLDTPGSTQALGKNNLYVAFTRARSRLALLCRNNDAARSYRLSESSSPS